MITDAYNDALQLMIANAYHIKLSLLMYFSKRVIYCREKSTMMIEILKKFEF